LSGVIIELTVVIIDIARMFFFKCFGPSAFVVSFLLCFTIERGDSISFFVEHPDIVDRRVS
jgi:hypothetical protein